MQVGQSGGLNCRHFLLDGKGRRDRDHSSLHVVQVPRIRYQLLQHQCADILRVQPLVASA